MGENAVIQPRIKKACPWETEVAHGESSSLVVGGTVRKGGFLTVKPC